MSISIKYINRIYFALLSVAALTIWLPFSFKSVFLLAGLVAAFKCRKDIHVDKQIKILAAIFFVYLALFTYLSNDPGRSIKGVYDIARGCLLFPIGILLGKLINGDKQRHYSFISISAVILLGNFFFSQDFHSVSNPAYFIFFGYSDKPNDISELFLGHIILSFGLIGRTKEDRMFFLLWLATFCIGLLLLALANSRGAWLSLLLAICAYSLLNTSSSLASRLRVLSVTLVGFAVLIFYFSRKSLGLRGRGTIMENVFNSTTEHSPLLGFGINYQTAPDIGLLYNYPHNVLLEIYASSGIIGLVSVSILFTYLVFYMLQKEYTKNSVFLSSISGIVAFSTLGLFNMRFGSFAFPASMCLFFGILYSQSSTNNAKTSGA